LSGQIPLIPSKNSLFAFSPHALEEIRSLMRPKPAWSLFTALRAWVEIGLAVAISVRIGFPWAYVLAVIFIATRQNVLALLVHEQVHKLGIKSKAGDRITNLISGFWLLLTVEGYKKVHLAHHVHYFTGRDPDFRNRPRWGGPFSSIRGLSAPSGAVVCDSGCTPRLLSLQYRDAGSSRSGNPRILRGSPRPECSPRPEYRESAQAGSRAGSAPSGRVILTDFDGDGRACFPGKGGQGALQALPPGLGRAGVDALPDVRSEAT
jgi:hypothetical protein